ncbi:hypothetical protein GCM10010129_00210 [Streptomyces fumigatiscleroticus]|nr:hypothetical protein GCM10010129_00210 [Streptomyces fumigatiscleroticus]
MPSWPLSPTETPTQALLRPELTGVRGRAARCCQGAGGAVRVAHRGHRDKRSAGRRGERHPATFRALGEQAVAPLKAWRPPRRLHFSTTHVTDPVKTHVSVGATSWPPL